MPPRRSLASGKTAARKAAARRASTQPAASLTHLDARGQARMVDIGDKPVSARVAIARARVRMQASTLRTLNERGAAKGDVLAVARVAGIQAAKRTPELIPLCHVIALTRTEIAFTSRARSGVLEIEARISALDRTGAEMEALTAVAVAALAVYDMLKSIDRGMRIEDIALYEKHGGKTGSWTRSGDVSRSSARTRPKPRTR